eukprot:m.39091 g.39091  ORF g.39091 m.39091 type:complete len:338 (-) comp10085_c0_seq1:21-1034(-)
MEEDLNVPWDKVHIPTFLALATTFSVGENAILYPLETLKTRAQVDPTKQQLGFAWMLKSGRQILQREGVRGLYRGYGWFTFASLPSNIVYITSYNSLKQKLLNYTDPNSTLVRTAAVPMAAGALADVASILLWNPVEVVVQRLQLERHRPSFFFDYHARNSMLNRFAGARLVSHIYRTEGWRGFYRGLEASILTSAPASAFWWPAYECSKLALSPLFLQSKDDDAGEQSFRKHVLYSVSGLSAGAWTMLCTNPFDVAKTRLQTQTETYGATSALPAIARIFKHEGARGLMKGLTARLIYSVPASGLVSFTYELVLKLSLKSEEKVTLGVNVSAEVAV